MKSIAIFNNKGGVGKSTLTLFVADFFSSTKVTIADRRARVLIIDLDAQNSGATALLGNKKVKQHQDNQTCFDDLVRSLITPASVTLDTYMSTRSKSSSADRKIPLGELSVMVCSGEGMMNLEEKYRDRISIVLRERLKPLLAKHFDIVLFDLPANIDRRNFVPMAALVMTDFIVVPTEPTRITVNAMDKTFNIIRDAQGAARNAGYTVPKLAGIVLNKTDRRTKQYRLHAKEINLLAGKNDSLVFTNFLPNSPSLATAPDDSLNFETLRERYDTYYDHVRKVTKELAERCDLVRSKAKPKTAHASKRRKKAATTAT